jgi:hypothetical protein
MLVDESDEASPLLQPVAIGTALLIAKVVQALKNICLKCKRLVQHLNELTGGFGSLFEN